LLVSIVAFSGFRGILYKSLWTLFFCPLGMGGAMGGLVNCFITDKYYGSQAVTFVALLSLLVLGSCNDLCYKLDHYFEYFGSVQHLWWFHFRYPFILLGGVSNGRLLFTDDGQRKLASIGV
jgi:hypothetical protein